MNKSQRVLLLFPPGWSPFAPYLSLPQLSAFLRSNNISTRIVDLNIEILNKILTDSTIKSQFPLIENALEIEKDQDRYNELELCKRLFPLVDGKVDHALNRIRSKYVLPEEYIRLNRIIEIAFRIYSAIYFPGRINNGTLVFLNEFVARSHVQPNDYSPLNTVSRVVTAFNERETNPFWLLTENYIDNIEINKYDLVGISVCGYSQLLSALSIAYMIKKQYDIPIVLGGAIIPYLLEGIKNNPFFFKYFDFIVNGEGEIPLLKILKALEGNRGKPLREAGGVVYFDANNNRVVENQVDCAVDINSIPTPDFDGFNLNNYHMPIQLMSLPIMGSRGCYWGKCNFCGVNCNYYDKFRRRSTELIVQDMGKLSKRHDIKQFRFIDNCMSPLVVGELSNKLLELGHSYLWKCMARFENAFRRENWELAYKAGLRVVSFGLESNSQNILDRMNKGVEASQLSRILTECSAANIFIHCFFIIGFPGEGENDWYDTVDFIRNNEESIDSITINKFRLEYKSPIFNDLAGYNLEISKSYPHDYISSVFDHIEYFDIDERVNLIRSEIFDLKCSELNFSGLSDLFVIGSVFAGKGLQLLEWQKEKSQRAVRLKRVLMRQEYLDVKNHLKCSSINNIMLVNNTRDAVYWLFTGVDADSISDCSRFIEQRLEDYIISPDNNMSINNLLEMILENSI